MRQPPLLPVQRWLRCGIAAGTLVFLAIFAALPMSMFSVLPACTFKNLTGLPCALCGGTRSARAFLHGDLATAWYLNPLSLFVIIFMAVGVVILAWEAGCGRPFTDWRAALKRLQPWMPLILVLLIVWWVPHLLGALRVPKKELVDLRNPIAATLYRQVHKAPSP